MRTSEEIRKEIKELDDLRGKAREVSAGLKDVIKQAEAKSRLLHIELAMTEGAN